MSASIIYLIPSVLDDAATATIPPYIADALRDCQVIFAEQERTARRYFKSIWKAIDINSYIWYAIHKAEAEQVSVFKQCIKEGKNIAIVSEAGCPGIADPGQVLVEAAQQMGAIVKPLVGPSAILLALMASGLNGQHFTFTGYLPIETAQRNRAIQELEAQSQKTQCTKIFIETPYRNNALLTAILQTCKPHTRLCIAVDLTGPGESIRTQTINEWKKQVPELHKRPAIFLLQG
jgi:16S rRNA (cytidine1402-2'-O)-methyltransferase